MEDFSRWKEVFIDPGVYDLTKDYKFSWEDKINIPKFLDSLPDNHYFSWDYPGDMNLEYQYLFLHNTWNSAEMFHDHPQFIVTAQYKFINYWNFVEWFDKYNNLNIKSGILGLGNMCRFKSLTPYLKHAFDYAFSHYKHPRIHIYGLCMKAIPYAHKLAKRFNIEFSFDSTKWTRCYHTPGYPWACTKENRQQFFDEYKARVFELIEGVPE